MAVNDQSNANTPGKRFAVGANVIFAVVLAGAVVVLLQMIAHAVPSRVDMTSTGINSLSPGTENLLRGLEKDVRITSLYFEVDLEEGDQPRYRQAVQDLIDLYQSTNSGKVQAYWVNPLKDHEEYQKLSNRLRELPTFAEGIAKYEERIKKFEDEIGPQIQTLLQGELEGAGQAMGSNAMASSGGGTPVARVELSLKQLQSAFEGTQEQVETLTAPPNPQYAAAISELRSFYSQFSRALKEIGTFGTQIVGQISDLTDEEREYLVSAANRYADLAAKIESETSLVQELEPLKIDQLMAEINPTANPIVVETDEDAVVVNFSDVWPPVDPSMGSRVPFEKRAFKGEQELTAAILRVTHREQTAVVFVRFGGQPLFMGGMMPGQPQSPFAMLKDQLEDANFVVKEWDLKTSETPPDIDPAPTRTIFVVMKPTPPARGPMGQPSQEPPFSDKEKEAFLKAFGDKGRALFIAGWSPGPFGPVPDTYEYDQYLTDNWGIDVDTSTLLIQVISLEPGHYAATRSSFNIDALETTDQVIVANPLTSDMVLPWCAPLKLSESPPEGVRIEPLIEVPEREDLWGIRDITKYQQQLQQREYLTREETDSVGPFVVAAAATKGDAKIVVASSREFANDAVAFSREMALTSRGLTVRARNPGNVIFFVNALHWLNDNTEFMNVGQPIESAVLQIPNQSTVRVVQVLTIFAWPALALVLGGAVWIVRRR